MYSRHHAPRDGFHHAERDAYSKNRCLMKPIKLRLAILLALGIGLAPLYLTRAEDNAPPLKTEYFNGKVMPLADILKKQGVKLDADAAPTSLALVTDDNKIYPLVKDDGCRMFFKDAQLLNRPMRLTGRLLPGSMLLQVVNVHSLVEGKLHNVYYWCDICTIKTFEPGICACCGAPMEFREVVVK